MFMHNSIRAELAAPLQRMAAGCALLGCVLSVSCTLDAKPQPQARSGSVSEQPGSEWLPPGAAGREARSDAAVPGSPPVRAAQRDAGVVRAGGSAPRPASDAGARPVPDAGQTRPDAAGPAVPMRDASTSSTPRQDASTSPPPTTPRPDASTTPPPTTPRPDASTPPPPTTPPPTMPPPITPMRDASTPTPTPTPDASTPTVPSACKPGIYSGAFSGTVRAANQQVADTSGTLRAELVLDPSGTSLLLRDAGAMIVDDENRLEVSLSGRVNCTSRRLEQGLIDGSFYYADVNTTLPFHGTLEGAYTPDPAGVTGTWSGASDDISLLAAQGTWSLLLEE